MRTEIYERIPYPQTPDSAWRWFREHGICISRWARHFGFDRFDVVDLLRGKRDGRWGRAHEAAICLGLKPEPQKRNAAS